MLTVDDYGQIRRAHRDGMSIRGIARAFRRSRRKVREALASPEPRPYARSRPASSPKLGAFHAVIDQILIDDEQAPPKQRHTAMQVYRRLVREQGYGGGYDAVRRYVGRRRRVERPTFIPLDHAAGQRVEADFGHIHVDFPGGRRLTPVLLLTWSYSHAVFAMAVPTERLEAILWGIVAGLEFFGCGPRELWWDNPRTLVSGILTGRQRKVNPRYAALASHYRFDPMFCMPASGWEKPDVEHRVYDLQRRWATPVPRVADYDQLNAHLRVCCAQERDRAVAGQTQTIGERFEQEKTAALALPRHPFDPCVATPAKVDHYQMVRYDRSCYSVPHGCRGPVTIKAYPQRIEVVHAGRVVAGHRRRYDGGQTLDPLHYLPTLSHRPAALDGSNVYRRWSLPACFTDLRQELESRHGPAAGVRQYIRVLQLLVAHPLAGPPVDRSPPGPRSRRRRCAADRTAHPTPGAAPADRRRTRSRPTVRRPHPAPGADARPAPVRSTAGIHP
jgi:transposase